MEKFDKYLDDIGISSTIKTRIETIIDEYETILGDDIDDIFVSEYVNSEGGKELESLFLFNKKNLMEAKSFINSDNYDIAPLVNKISYYQLQKDNFDFVKVSVKSRLTIEINLINAIGAELKASEKNCLHLYEISKKYFFNNAI